MSGESLARGECIEASINVAGEEGANSLRRDEYERLGVNGAQGSGVDCHKHLRAASTLVGSTSGTAHRVSVHDALLSDSRADESEHAENVIPLVSVRTTPLEGVATLPTGNNVRGESPREVVDESRWTDEDVSSSALFGHFPHLPPPRCARIEPWAPPKFAPEGRVLIPDSDVLGLEHGLLTALRRVTSAKGRKGFVLCRCRCGKLAEYPADRLVNGLARSCGYGCPRRSELTKVVAHPRERTDRQIMAIRRKREREASK
jgi:hypothetical protein